MGVCVRGYFGEERIRFEERKGAYLIFSVQCHDTGFVCTDDGLACFDYARGCFDLEEIKEQIRNVRGDRLT